jgi:hypothetical protein
MLLTSALGLALSGIATIVRTPASELVARLAGGDGRFELGPRQA